MLSDSSFNLTQELFRNGPFWIWDRDKHRQEYILRNGNCCFNHTIGLPRKSGIEKPLFDYERIIFDTLQLNKHVWIKKATGLGITEFMLRYIAWLTLKDDALKGSQMCIVTGPRIDLAIDLIDRLKKIFYERINVIFDTRETVIELNGVKIEAFPSHHLDAMRGLANVSFVLLDEADFFPVGQQQDARDVSERYIAKSNPYIVMVSTPNAPNGLFDKIEREPEQNCIYNRLFLDYTYGIDKIYTNEDIENAKRSPSFDREYNLKYLGIIGNTFHTQDIDEAVKIEYDPEIIDQNCYRTMGIDPAFGSSSFGIVVTQLRDERIQVLYADEFERPNYYDMINKIWEIIGKFSGVDAIYVDAANPEIISTLKRELNEDDDWNYIHERISYCKKNNLQLEREMKVIPIPFSIQGTSMMAHVKSLLENKNRVVAIRPEFDKLITSLKTAVTDDMGRLDKQATLYHDIFDAFRLALRFYVVN